MNKGIYIATLEPNSGKSIVTLGLMRILLGKIAKVSYFRPIIDDKKKGEKDNHIATVLSNFDVDMKYSDAFAFTRSQIIKKRIKGHAGEIMDTIIAKYKELEDRFDFVLVEGSDFTGEGSVFEFDTNVLIAKNLGIPAIVVASGVGKTEEELLGSMQIAYTSFRDRDVSVMAMVANKVQRENLKIATKGLRDFLPKDVAVFSIPFTKKLAHPTIKEIVEELDGKVLFGANFIDNQTGSFGVGAMQLRNYLTHLKTDSLVVTPGDRADIILGALQANISSNYPRISGIILTGGLIPEESILKLIEGLSQIVPIVSVSDGTFSVANRIGSIKSKIYADSNQKIETSLALFEKQVNFDDLVERLISFQPSGITPRMFQYGIMKRAKAHKKHIVLPEGIDERILSAAARLVQLDIVEITLLGKGEDSRKNKNERNPFKSGECTHNRSRKIKAL